MSKRPKRMHEVQRTKEETAVGERREDRQPEGESVVRGRPGRRTVEERQQAVLDLFSSGSVSCTRAS